jgi:hypothetical protein
MPVPFDNLTAAQIESSVQNNCTALRNALYQFMKDQAWLAQYSQVDFTAAPPNGPGMSQNATAAMFSAVADANGLALLATTGTDPRNPGPDYVYMTTINAVAGPLS